MASMPGYEFLGAPNAFTVTNSATSGSITGSSDLVGTITGYTYDNSTVSGCASGMTINGSSAAQVGGDKTSADLDALK
jgi:hypothetical protein